MVRVWVEGKNCAGGKYVVVEVVGVQVFVVARGGWKYGVVWCLRGLREQKENVGKRRGGLMFTGGSGSF